MINFFTPLLDSFIAIFIIIDPFLGLAVFSSMAAGMSIRNRAKQATVAAGVALALLIIFMFTGMAVLNLMGIQFSSFKVAGGLILLLLGIQSVLGFEFSKIHENKKFAAVLIGTPLLCGPGAMTAITVLSKKHGYLPPLIASILALYITWLMLVYSHKIESIVGARIIKILSRVMGLFVAALAVQFIWDGVAMMIASAR